MSQFDASPGMGSALVGSSRVNPSKIEVTTRKSGSPVMMAGSSDCGSAPFTITRSARGSFRVQPANSSSEPAKNRSWTARIGHCAGAIKIRKPRLHFERGFVLKFIGLYLAGAGGGFVVAAGAALLAVLNSMVAGGATGAGAKVAPALVEDTAGVATGWSVGTELLSFS